MTFAGCDLHTRTQQVAVLEVSEHQDSLPERQPVSPWVSLSSA